MKKPNITERRALQAQLLRDFCQTMRDNGATQRSDGDSVCFVMDTNAGRLTFTMHRSDEEDGRELFSIYIRADIDRDPQEVKRAAQEVREAFSWCPPNPFNLKWNIHGLDPRWVLEELRTYRLPWLLSKEAHTTGKC